ncbi:hypothetical protein GGER_03500 [Serratia rubidaea]
MMTLTRTAALLTLLAALSGCGLMTTTPKPPPPPIAGQAQEVTRAQTFGLEKMTTVSALVHGSPMNVEEAIQKKPPPAAPLLPDYHEQRNRGARAVVLPGHFVPLGDKMRHKA